MCFFKLATAFIPFSKTLLHKVPSSETKLLA